jgi:adenine specific DNA methylase Mod
MKFTRKVGDGCFYYHCDWHKSHYIKVMLDHIFDENNFQNKFVVCRNNVNVRSGK